MGSYYRIGNLSSATYPVLNSNGTHILTYGSGGGDHTILAGALNAGDVYAASLSGSQMVYFLSTSSGRIIYSDWGGTGQTGNLSSPRALSNVRNNIYYYNSNYNFSQWVYDGLPDKFNTVDEIFGNFASIYSITYRDTNCTHSGPDEAAVGDSVTVSYTFPDGYGIINISDIYVTNNGVIIPSTYANGTLTFTMPDPS